MTKILIGCNDRKTIPSYKLVEFFLSFKLCKMMEYKHYHSLLEINTQRPTLCW